MTNEEKLKGVDWFNVEKGEWAYTRRSAALRAFINSSDMSPNAHAGQDRLWRLGPVWRKKLDEALENPDLIDAITKGSGKISDPALLVALWNREVKAARNRDRRGNTKAKYEQKYRDMIAESENDTAPDAVSAPTHIPVKDESRTTKVNVRKK